MRIAVDALGGDYAPKAIMKGVELAAKKFSDVTLIVIGQDEGIVPALSNVDFQLATEKIEADDEPVKAVRTKKDSSMVIGCKLLKEKALDAFISAGNTGALMAAGLFYTKRLKGVDRPALAPVFPTLCRKGMLVLDIGANAEAKPEHLHQYALMGSVYAEKVLDFTNPRVGLLNLGTEPGKGTELTKATYQLLENESGIQFVGNIEARDIFYSPCDVLICDGFSGNLLLKTTEGVSKAIFDQLKIEFTRNIFSKLAATILKPGLVRFKKEMDYKEHGGAPLLGLRGPIIKAHGSSDARAIFNAIRQARTFVRQDVISKIEEELFIQKEVGI